MLNLSALRDLQIALSGENSVMPKPSAMKHKRRIGRHTHRKRTRDRRVVELRCDYLTKILVHRRDGERCVKCGGHEHLQAAHILPKGKYPLMRHVLDNLLSLC